MSIFTSAQNSGKIVSGGLRVMHISIIDSLKAITMQNVVDEYHAAIVP